MKKNLLFVVMILLIMSSAKAQVDFVWGKQFGTDKEEKTRNLITDSSGNVYVLGKTMGAIGKENFGKNDGFIVKVDSSANTIWTLQIGSKEDDDLEHAAIDNAGNLYVTGFIGVNDKNTFVSQTDVLVVKINRNGEILWQKQFGTDSMDIGHNIIISSNDDIYITGSTKGVMGSASKGQTDCFILHLDNEGNQLNILQFGTSGNDEGYGITIGADAKIYVCGNTGGDMAAKNAGKSDVFWGIFSNELKQQEMKQFGTNENDYIGEIKTDNKNNIYIAGNTDGNTVSQHQGYGDAFLQKWNEKGELAWTKQFGTSNWDGMHSIAIFQDKGIIVSGCYDYPLCKSFVQMYDEQGTLLWYRNTIAQGKGGGSCGKDVCVNKQGYIYHAGYTGANLFSELKGKHDLFLMKLKADMK